MRRLKHIFLSALLPLCIAASAQTRTTVKVAVIPVQFDDVVFPVKDSVRLRIDSVFNAKFYAACGASGSVSDYFSENLGPRYELSFKVLEPLTLPFAESHYVYSGKTGSAAGIALISNTITAAVTAGYDFSEFDGDSDGFIDAVYILYAGYGEAENAEGNVIDPHEWDVSSKNIKAGAMKVGKYCCSSYYYGKSGARLTPIGIICHETGHILGLYDMYDVNGEVEGKSEGLWGSTSLMDRGNYNNGGRTPPVLNCVEREILGTVDIKEIKEPGKYSMGAVGVTGEVFRISTSDPDEYFLLEYRDGTGWDRYAGGTGLLAYHVDKSPADAGSMSATERWMVNAVNGCSAHQCVDLMEACTSADTSAIFFPGDSAISWFTSVSAPPLLSWDGTGPMLCLKDIATIGDKVFFTVAEDRLWLEPSMTGSYVRPYQTDAEVGWSTAKSMPGEWHVYWRVKDEDYWQSSDALSAMSYRIANLSPGVAYECKVTYSRLGVSFDVFSSKFSTSPFTSGYPVIAGIGGEHYIGDTLSLRVFNVAETVLSESWTVNGAKFDSSSYPLVRGGILTIAVSLKYSDGSVERISRNVTVSEKKRGGR